MTNGELVSDAIDASHLSTPAADPAAHRETAAPSHDGAAVDCAEENCGGCHCEEEEPRDEKAVRRMRRLLDRIDAAIEAADLDIAAQSLAKLDKVRAKIVTTAIEDAVYFETVAAFRDACDDTDAATAVLKSAGAWWRTALDESGEEVEVVRRFAANRVEVAHRLEDAGDLAQAAAVADEAIGRIAPLPFDQQASDSVFEARCTRAAALFRMNRTPEAVPVARDAVEMSGNMEGENVIRDRARAHGLLGQILADAGDCRGAVDACRTAIEAFASIDQPPTCRGVLGPRVTLAKELSHIGNTAGSVAEFAKYFELVDRDVEDPDEAMRLASQYNDYAEILEQLHRCADSAEASAVAAELMMKAIGSNESAAGRAAIFLANRAASLLHVGRNAEAHEAVDRALTLAAEGSEELAMAHDCRSRVLEADEKYALAAEAAHVAVEVFRAFGDDSRKALAVALTRESVLLDRCGDGSGALAAAGESMALWDSLGEEVRNANVEEVVATHEARGEALLTLKECEEAHGAFHQAIGIALAVRGDRAMLRTAARLSGRLAIVHAHHGEVDAALRAHAERVAILRRLEHEGDASAAADIAKSLVHRAELLSVGGDEAGFVSSIDAGVVAAKAVGRECLTDVLEIVSRIYRDRGDYAATAKYAVEAAALLRDRIGEGSADLRDELFAMTSQLVCELADAGEATAIARLLECAMAAGAPDGATDPAGWQSVLDSCRQLAEPQLRRVHASMEDGGSALRMLSGR